MTTSGREEHARRVVDRNFGERIGNSFRPRSGLLLFAIGLLLAFSAGANVEHPLFPLVQQLLDIQNGR